MAKKRDPFNFDTEELSGLDSDMDEVVLNGDSEDEEEEVEQEDVSDIEFEDPAENARQSRNPTARRPPPRVQEPEVEEDQAEAEEEEFDLSLVDYDKKLEIAQLWRVIIDHDLLDQRSGWAAKRVQQEVRKFARQQLGILMGGASPTAQAALPWSKEQIEVLTQLADTLMAKRNQGLKPLPSTPVAPPAPVLRKLVPTAPVAKVPPPQPRVQSRPAAPAPQKTAVKAPQRPPVPVAQQPAAVFEKDDRVPEKYLEDPTLIQKNGRWFVQLRDGDQKPLWSRDKGSKIAQPILKDITRQSRPSIGTGQQPLPMPGKDQFSMIMQNQAANMVGYVERKAAMNNFSGLLQHTMVHNLTGNEE